MASSLALQFRTHPVDPGRELSLIPERGARRDGAVAVLFASRLIVAMPGGRSSSVDAIQVVDALGAGRALRQWMTLDHLTAATEDRSPTPYTLIVLPLEDLSGLDLTARLKFSVRCSGEADLDVVARPEVLRLDGETDTLLLGFVATVAESGGLDARVTAIFGPDVRRMDAAEMGRVRLLRAHRTVHAVIVEGVIENLALRDLALATRDLSVVVPPETMILRAADVPLPSEDGLRDESAWFEEERLSFGGTLVQHFTAVFNRTVHPLEDIVLLEMRHEELLISEPLALPPGRIEAAALSSFIDGLGEEAAMTPKKAVAVLAPLLAVPIPSLSPAHHRFGPREGEPKFSVVVALSGEELFLRSLLAQQAMLPVAVEWILCVEHTPLSAGFLQLLASSSGRLMRATTLLTVNSSCGPVRLKNLGVEAAAAETVAFLDEGAWIEDAKPWLVAYREIRERRFDVVGVGSHFSDGTIDNEGMLRSRARGNALLQRADFRRRGFPSLADGNRTSVEPVEAVSSAAMLTSRARFQTVGGFDESYALTEFADLDLSLRAARAGAQIGFVRGRGTVRGRSGAELGRSSTRARAYAVLEGARLALDYPLQDARQESAW